MSRMLNLLSLAEVSQEVEENEDLEFVLETESVSEESRIAVMFDRMMLVELREAGTRVRMQGVSLGEKIIFVAECLLK